MQGHDAESLVNSLICEEINKFSERFYIGSLVVYEKIFENINKITKAFLSKIVLHIAQLGRSIWFLNGEGLRYGWDWVVPQASPECDLWYWVISQ